MVNNVSGNVDASADADFKLFDKLPSSVKEAIRNSPENLSTENMLAIKRRYGLDYDELADEIEVRVIARTAEICRSTYGRDHPQSDQHCGWALQLYPRNTRLTALK